MGFIRRNKPRHDLDEKPAHSIVWQINSVKRFAHLQNCLKLNIHSAKKIGVYQSRLFYFIQK